MHFINKNSNKFSKQMLQILRLINICQNNHL